MTRFSNTIISYVHKIEMPKLKYCEARKHHYCFRFDREVIHVVVGYIVYQYSLRFDRGVVHVVVVGYNVYHICFWFDRGVVHVVVVIFSTSTL